MMMKLQNKINLRFLLILIAVFTIAGVALYFVLEFVADNNIDEMLRTRAEKIKQGLQDYPETALLSVSVDPSISVRPSTGSNSDESYRDTLVYDNFEKEYISYRGMRFTENVNGKTYEVAILMSRIESEDMIEAILLFLLGLFTLIVLVLFLLNNWLSSVVWKPFYLTMEKLKLFKVGETGNLVFDKTNVLEFDQMNRVLAEMVRKLRVDFTNLKDFTENAAHEMQTPLAVIKSKLEMVLQNKELTDKSYTEISKAFESANKLSKLNETLLLLSRIKNQQFVEETDTDLCNIISQRLTYVDELIKLKNIEIITDLGSSFIVRINPYLAEILINNLLSNALKHNYEGGKIIITSTDNQALFSNTGKPLSIATDKLFQRFVKHNADSESAGLGLAISSEICNNFGLALKYSYQNGFHNIILYDNRYDTSLSGG